MKSIFSTLFFSIGLCTASFAGAHEGAEVAVLFEESRHDPDAWGYHLLLDCKGCSIDAITDEKVLDGFVRDLVDRIDMKMYGEPILKHFAEHTPEAAGYSLLQLIETSSITGHFCDINGDAYIDIFSCKCYAPETAIQVVEEWLGPEKIQVRFLVRKI